MAAEYYRKSGQIPAFGDWENAHELPITQYFECARQAGLLRCSCSGECGGAYVNNGGYWGGGAEGYEKPLPRRVYVVPERKTRGANKGNEQRKQVKVRDLMKQPRNQAAAPHKHKPSIPAAKPVDEDLYKIPPELLENSKRKKMLGFFSKCMVPPCAA